MHSRRERENGPSVPRKRQNRWKNGAECGESATGLGPGGLPSCRERTSREVILRSARSRIQCTRQLHRREQNQETEESRQADPVSRSKSAQKRQHKRMEGDYCAYCLMHASLKQSLRGASSGSPDNAWHSLVKNPNHPQRPQPHTPKP